MKKTVDIMDYCNKLFAADLFAGVVLEEDFDTGYDYTWSAASEDWADKFRTELNGYISAGCCEERAADYRKALAILDEMEQAAEQTQTSAPEAVKCADLYTATFEDGTLMTGTLGQLYKAQNNRRMTIKPVVWLWCSDSGLYMVDYILEGAGWTLGVFDTLADAEKAVAAFNAQPAADVAAMLTADALKRFTCEVECKALGDDGKQYNAVWCPDCGQIYYTIPANVKVLGYIPQYEEG